MARLRRQTQSLDVVPEQNLVTRALKGLAKIALHDSQLSQIGELQVDGETEPLLQLAYGYQRHLVLASHGSRLVILSMPVCCWATINRRPPDVPGCETAENEPTEYQEPKLLTPNWRFWLQP